jgi:hypothetical protein
MTAINPTMIANVPEKNKKPSITASSTAIMFYIRYGAMPQESTLQPALWLLVWHLELASHMPRVMSGDVAWNDSVSA